jgi:hypothetical protein
LKYSFPFFGDEWIKTGGIGEFTGGGVEGLRAIARAGWRAEDHALNLAGFTNLIKDRETVNAEIPLSGLRWIISHVPEFPYGRRGWGTHRRVGTEAVKYAFACTLRFPAPEGEPAYKFKGLEDVARMGPYSPERVACPNRTAI